MRYAGIDPGLDGALSVIEQKDGLAVAYFHDTPTVVVGSGKTSKREYLIPEMASNLMQYQKDGLTVVIEKVGAMPGQGVTSMFTFGKGFGIWLGILGALQIPYTLVHPKTWKKAVMADMGQDKDASRVRAIQLFPEFSNMLKLKKHHGRADALLMAEYGRRMNGTGR